MLKRVDLGRVGVFCNQFPQFSGSDKGHFAVQPRRNRTNCASRVHLFVIVPGWLYIRFPFPTPTSRPTTRRRTAAGGMPSGYLAFGVFPQVKISSPHPRSREWVSTQQESALGPWVGPRIENGLEQWEGGNIPGDQREAVSLCGCCKEGIHRADGTSQSLAARYCFSPSLGGVAIDG